MAGFSRYGVPGDTLLLTDRGHIPIGALEGQEVNIWNGDTFEQTTVFKMAEDQPLLRVLTNVGLELECTYDYPFYRMLTFEHQKEIEIVRASDLEPDMKLLRTQSHPVIDYGKLSFPYAYTHGFYMGLEKSIRSDGSLSRTAVFGRRRPILKVLELDEEATDNISLRFHSDFPEKYEIPDAALHSLETKMEWVSGLFDGGFNMRKVKPKPIYILHSYDWDYLIRLKLFFQTLGVDLRIMKNQDFSSEGMPYSMLLPSAAGNKLLQSGIKPIVKTLKEQHYVSKNERAQMPRIELVEDAYRTAHVFNFVGTKTKACVLNGIYVACN